MGKFFAPVCFLKGAVEDVKLVKRGGPLGLSIVGGSDHSSHPFGVDLPGVFVSKVVPDGAAAKTGKLRIGDRILSVFDDFFFSFFFLFFFFSPFFISFSYFMFKTLF